MTEGEDCRDAGSIDRRAAVPAETDGGLFRNPAAHMETDHRLMPGVAQPVSPPTARRHSLALARTHAASVLILALAVFAVYANTLDNAFVLDDRATIVENELVHSGATGAIFRTPSWFGQGSIEHGYRPLVTLSFALNYRLSGLRPASYHAANALLHALVTWSLYGLLLALGTKRTVALLCALLFAVHPLNTEAVASVTGRAEVMAALFVLLGLWVDASSYRTGGRRRALSGLAVALALGLGLLSKENAVTMVGAVAATDWLVRCEGSARRFARGLWGERGVLYGGLLLLVAAYVWWRLQVQSGVMPTMNAAMNPLRAEPLPVRWLNAVVIAGRYLWLWVMPVKLSADYMFGALPVVHTVWDWRVWASAAALAGCAGLGVWGAKRGARALTWGLVVSACTYSVVSNVAVPIQAMMAERWLYLPSAGLCVAAVLAGQEALGLLRPAVWRRAVGLAVAAMVLLLCGGRTAARNRDWHDSLRLWQATASARPGSYKAQQGLGQGYLEAGEYDKAVAALERAVGLYREPAALAMLGDAYMRAGRPADAQRAYGEAIARWQGQPDSDWRIGQLYLARMEPGLALPYLQRASSSHPGTGRVRVDLGKAYYLTGANHAAKREFEQALRLDPSLAEAHTGLAACAQAGGDTSTALSEYLRALELGQQPNERLRQQLTAVLVVYAAGHPDGSSYAQAALRYFPADETLQRLSRGR